MSARSPTTVKPPAPVSSVLPARICTEVPGWSVVMVTWRSAVGSLKS